MNKILIIGTGSIAQRHLKNLLKLNQKNLYIFSNSKFQKDKISKIYPKIIFIKKINYKNFSHIIFANSTSERFRLFNKNLELNKIKLYFEKPLACNLSQLKRLKKRNFRYFLAGFQLRAYPLIKKLKKIIQKDISNLKYCNLLVGHDLRLWRKDYNISKIFYSKNEKFSGVLWELSHEIDIINYLFGLPNYAYARNLQLMNFKKIRNDYSSIQLDFKKFSLNLVLEMISPKYRRKYEFIFEKKIIVLDLVKNQISLIYKNKERIIYKINNFDKNEMFLTLMKNFVFKKKHSFASFKDICINTKMLNILESSSKNKKLYPVK